MYTAAFIKIDAIVKEDEEEIMKEHYLHSSRLISKSELERALLKTEERLLHRSAPYKIGFRNSK